MASEFTHLINNQNVQNVRDQIALKKGFAPHYATVQQATQVLTDFDTFPYPRWFRGVPTSDRPIVAEREAGWRPRHDDCYKAMTTGQQVNHQNLCYQSACSTVYPCYPTSKINDEAIMLNNACIIEYR